MKDKRATPGGELEYAVLSTVWDLGRASIREIHDRVGIPNGLIYTTIAKVVERLMAKGLLSRSRSDGLFVYRACVRRETVERAQLEETLGRLLKLESAPAMATLVEALEALDPRLLDDLSKAVEEHRRGRK